MNFSQLPEFAQIKACELLSDQYSRCANETARVNLASKVQQAFVNLFTEGAPITAPVNATVEETSAPSASRKVYSSNGNLLCDVLYDNKTGTTIDIDEAHQDVKNALCQLPKEAIPPKIKNILILEEQTIVIRGKLSDEQLIDWLQKLIIAIEQPLNLTERIQRQEHYINQNKEMLISKKDYLNSVII